MHREAYGVFFFFSFLSGNYLYHAAQHRDAGSPQWAATALPAAGSSVLL